MAYGSVSVIIATNRGGDYLAEAVTSVRAQTIAVSEVLLVDDGSPSPGLVRTAEELGLIYIRQHAAGVSAARNAGAAAATGQWIAFLDDDDVWHPERIRCQLEALARSPGSIGSYTGGWYMDEAGAPFGDGWGAPPAPTDEMIRGSVPLPRLITVLVRRDVYIMVGGCRPDMQQGEDNELVLRLLLAGDLVAVDRPLIGYRRHARNVTRRRLPGTTDIRDVLEEHRRGAVARGDDHLATMLGQNLRALRRSSAEENLGELITALRSGDWSYARAVAARGVYRMPFHSVTAVYRRALRRRRRFRPSR